MLFHFPPLNGLLFSAVTVAKDPRYAKYFQMVKVVSSFNGMILSTKLIIFLNSSHAQIVSSGEIERPEHRRDLNSESPSTFLNLCTLNIVVVMVFNNPIVVNIIAICN